MMPRVVAMAIMTMRMNNQCGGNDDATMATRINPLCTGMMTSNKHSRGDDDQGEQRHTMLGVGGAIGRV